MGRGSLENTASNSFVLVPKIWLTHAGPFSGELDGTEYEDGFNVIE